LATAPLEIASFLELTAVFAHAVAEVHGVHVDDPESKRLLILAVTLGGPGADLVEHLAGRSGAHWGRLLVRRVPAETLKRVNKALGRSFLTKYGTKQGALVLGRAAPFFLGSAIGAAGNAALAQGSIAAARRAFGPPPALFPYAMRDGESDDDVIEGEVVDP
jgi:hypothetical protein